MNFYAFSALLNSIIFVFVFVILLAKQKKPRAANFFSFTVLTMFVWSVAYFFWQMSTTYEEALLWVKLLMFGAIYIGPSLLTFSVVLTQKEKLMLPWLIAIYAVAIFFTYINFTSNQFIGGLETKLGINFFPTAGTYFYYFLGQWTLQILIALYIMIQATRAASGEEKEMLSVMTTSLTISFIAGSFNYFLWFNIPIPPVTTLVSGTFALAAAFLMIKGKFYKLNLSYFEFFSGVAVLISILQFVLSQQINQFYINILTSVIVLLSSFFIFHFGNRERQHLEKIIALNAALSESLRGVINNINSAVIIINKKSTIIEVNHRALEMFGYEKDDFPKTFLNFIRGKVNKALIYTLEDYYETGRSSTTTTVLIPNNINVNIIFSPFTIDEKNDGTLIMYIETKNT